MPITKELENIRKFESVGFSHEQAEILADVIEQSHVNGHQSLKDFINDKFKEVGIEFKDLRSDIQNRFKEVEIEFKEVRSEIKTSELQMKASHTDLLMKIFAIIVGCTSIAIAISKVWK